MPQKVPTIVNQCTAISKTRAKTRVFSRFCVMIFALMVAFLAASCAPDSEFPTSPDDKHSGNENSGQNASTTVSIAYLRTLYTGAPTRITGEYWIYGTIVSNDRAGNFYKTLVLQDDTGGVEIKIGQEEIFKLFPTFTRVSVRCNGLWLNSFGGSMQLSAGLDGNGATRDLSPTQIAEHLRHDANFYGEVVPQNIRFSDIEPRHISTFIMFDEVQFAAEELGLDWAETTPENQYFTNRYLIDSEGNRLAVRTSRYASFAGFTLPERSGSIAGILGYSGGEYHLMVSFHTDTDMRTARF